MKTPEVMSCQAPGCGKVIYGQPDKKFVAVESGDVISLRRCDECVKKYEAPGSLIRKVEDGELRLLLSPAQVRANILADRRRRNALSRSRGGKSTTRFR